RRQAARYRRKKARWGDGGSHGRSSTSQRSSSSLGPWDGDDASHPRRRRGANTHGAADYEDWAQLFPWTRRIRLRAARATKKAESKDSARVRTRADRRRYGASLAHYQPSSSSSPVLASI